MMLVHGQSEPGPNCARTLLAHVPPFGITDVVQDQGADMPRLSPPVITGAQFDAQAVVEAGCGPASAEYEPVSYKVMDPNTRIIAVFDLLQSRRTVFTTSSDQSNGLHRFIAPYPISSKRPSRHDGPVADAVWLLSMYEIVINSCGPIPTLDRMGQQDPRLAGAARRGAGRTGDP